MVAWPGGSRARGRYEVDCIAADMKIEVKTGKPHRKYPPNVEILGCEDIPVFLYALGST